MQCSVPSPRPTLTTCTTPPRPMFVAGSAHAAAEGAEVEEPYPGSPRRSLHAQDRARRSKAVARHTGRARTACAVAKEPLPMRVQRCRKNGGQ